MRSVKFSIITLAITRLKKNALSQVRVLLVPMNIFFLFFCYCHKSRNHPSIFIASNSAQVWNPLENPTKFSSYMQINAIFLNMKDSSRNHVFFFFLPSNNAVTLASTQRAVKTTLINNFFFQIFDFFFFVPLSSNKLSRAKWMKRITEYTRKSSRICEWTRKIGTILRNEKRGNKVQNDVSHNFFFYSIKSINNISGLLIS